MEDVKRWYMEDLEREGVPEFGFTNRDVPLP